MSTCPEKRPLLPLALLFLRIGIMGFGGALANMALMEQACVKQHKWLTQAHYLEGVALSYLLPGPTAVLLSIYLGSRRRGLVGGVVSGLSFIAPAVVLTFVFSWVYFQYHSIPAISALFAGLGPVVVALILAMLYRAGKTALTSVSRSGLGLVVGVLLVFPLLPQAWNLITLLLLSGLVGILFFHERTTTVGSTSVIGVAGMGAFMREAALSLSPGLVVLLALAFVFLKASLVMFGGGVVAIPLFQQELVQTYDTKPYDAGQGLIHTLTLLPNSVKQADFMPHLPREQQSAMDESWSPPFLSVRVPSATPRRAPG